MFNLILVKTPIQVPIQLYHYHRRYKTPLLITASIVLSCCIQIEKGEFFAPTFHQRIAYMDSVGKTVKALEFGERMSILIMTAEEMKRRKLAVENMYRLYEKYYPLWVKKKEE